MASETRRFRELIEADKARRDPDFIIKARTDARATYGVMEGPDLAVSFEELNELTQREAKYGAAR